MKSNGYLEFAEEQFAWRTKATVKFTVRLVCIALHKKLLNILNVTWHMSYLI